MSMSEKNHVFVLKNLRTAHCSIFVNFLLHEWRDLGKGLPVNFWLSGRLVERCGVNYHERDIDCQEVCQEEHECRQPAPVWFWMSKKIRARSDLTSWSRCQKRAVVSENPRSAPRSEIRDPRYEDSLHRLKLKFDPPFEACYAVHFRVIERLEWLIWRNF